MDASLYVCKRKPQRMIVTKAKERRRNIGLVDDDLLPKPKLNPIMICASSECHVTPLDVGQRMIQYLGGIGTLLEPSAGTGNLVFAALNQGFDINSITAVERHYDLIQALNTRFKQDDLTVRHQCFLDYSENTDDRFDYIVINPPFKAAKSHIKAAKKLLNLNGVMVALVPVSFDDVEFEWLEDLPNTTFGLAKVNTKLIRYKSIF
ncbi:MAG: class I SAM-dependent methyltransferase [Cocleimonas sp.]